MRVVHRKHTHRTSTEGDQLAAFMAPVPPALRHLFISPNPPSSSSASSPPIQARLVPSNPQLLKYFVQGRYPTIYKCPLNNGSSRDSGYFPFGMPELRVQIQSVNGRSRTCCRQLCCVFTPAPTTSRILYYGSCPGSREELIYLHLVTLHV